MQQKTSVIDVWLGSKYVSANWIGNNAVAELIFFIKQLCHQHMQCQINISNKIWKNKVEKKRKNKEKFPKNFWTIFYISCKIVFLWKITFMFLYISLVFDLFLRLMVRWNLFPVFRELKTSYSYFYRLYLIVISRVSLTNG